MVELKVEASRLQGDLAVECKRAEGLAVKAERFEIGGCASVVLGLLGNLVSLLGGGLLGYAGAAPKLTDIEKARWVGGGIAALGIGMLFLIVAPVFAFWVKSKRING